MLQASDLIPTLLKSVEKAVAQPIQPNSVSEGLCASLLLIGVSKAKLEKENGLSIMWSTALDMDKQLFVAEKFLQNASENSKLIGEQQQNNLLVFVTLVKDHIIFRRAVNLICLNFGAG